jgi:hypothetical protein
MSTQISIRIPDPVLTLLDEWADYIAERRHEPRSRGTALEVVLRNAKIPRDAPGISAAFEAYQKTREIPA